MRNAGVLLHKMPLPHHVIMGECWPRDGLQNEEQVVSTQHKVEVITALVEAGFTKMEATSFAHPRYLPQFADAEEVLKRIPRKPGVSYRGICTTLKGVERAMDSKAAGYGVDELAFVISASEPHNLANVGMSQHLNQRMLDQMCRTALDSGHKILGWVLTSFGCPIMGDVKVEDALAMGKWWKEMGASWVGFGDTTGAANPAQVSAFYEHVLANGMTPEELVVHFHDTRGWGMANTLVALTFGMTHYDSSLGAIGGQPKTGAAAYHKGFSGNTCTEDLVGMLEEMCVATGVHLERMMAAGHKAEAVLGRQLRSNYLQAGPVPHHGIIYDKQAGIVGALDTSPAVSPRAQAAAQA